jgi:uncharacterized protein (DUF433 family)
MTEDERQNAANWRDRIDCDPAVLMGKPRIKGTRISVAFVLEWLGHGHSFNDVLDNYPHLTREDIAAAVACAADMLRQARSLPDVDDRQEP